MSDAEVLKEISAATEEGAKLYAEKNYEAAADKYASACEAYNQAHEGEDDPNLLYLYGKSLFQIGVSKSEVLGGGSADSGQPGPAEEPAQPEKKGIFQFSEDTRLGEDADTEAAEGEEEAEADGDDDKEEEEEDNQEEEGDGEAEDSQGNEAGDAQSDFELAWEILDLARALFEKRIEHSNQSNKSSENTEDSEEVKEIKRKLSDTYDLLGEVSLESENFPQAAEDLEKSLKLRQELDPESTLISESHYKLSLALELCVEMPDAKEKAVEHMKEAIKIVEKREKKGQSNDKSLLSDLKARLTELTDSTNEQILANEKQEILGALLGNSISGVKEPAKAGENVLDINALVKKKSKPPGKRPVEAEEDATTKRTKNS